MNNNTYVTKMYLYKLNIVLSKEYINYMYNYKKLILCKLDLGNDKDYAKSK